MNGNDKSLLNQMHEQQVKRSTEETIRGYMGHRDSDKLSSGTRVEMRTITSVYNSGSQGQH
jgi:hypothetical protein